MALTSISTVKAEPNQAPNQLRVQLPAKLPIDPLYMRSMAEYDISLMLWQAWFKYDKGRRADHGVVKSWTFDNKRGEYTFQIDAFKWSDGSDLTAEHLAANLRRISKSKTAYAKSLNAIVDLRSIDSAASKTLKFKTKTRKPSDTLFNQFGSVFFSIVHPKELDKTGLRLKSNNLSLGPYKINATKGDETTFSRNPYFKNENESAPVEVVVRPLQDGFSIADFLKRRTWANYYQANTLLESSVADRLVKSKFPIWSRGFDRVALLRPLGKLKRLEANRHIVQLIGWRLGELKTFTHPLQVALAKSLQPFGYPLFNEVAYAKPKRPVPKKIKILSYTVPQLELIRPWLDKILEEEGIEASWNILPPERFLTMDWESSGDDLVLFSFGVADPEPTTWLSLILGSKFVRADADDSATFAKLVKVTDPERQIKGYRKLLANIAKKGGYVPLFHGATIAMGYPELDFHLIDPLDETVDYSKIKFSN